MAAKASTDSATQPRQFRSARQRFVAALPSTRLPPTPWSTSLPHPAAHWADEGSIRQGCVEPVEIEHGSRR
jgi:hypothetical protein